MAGIGQSSVPPSTDQTSVWNSQYTMGRNVMNVDNHNNVQGRFMGISEKKRMPDENGVPMFHIGSGSTAGINQQQQNRPPPQTGFQTSGLLGCGSDQSNLLSKQMLTGPSINSSSSNNYMQSPQSATSLIGNPSLYQNRDSSLMDKFNSSPRGVGNMNYLSPQDNSYLSGPGTPNQHRSGSSSGIFNSSQMFNGAPGSSKPRNYLMEMSHMDQQSMSAAVGPFDSNEFPSLNRVKSGSSLSNMPPLPSGAGNIGVGYGLSAVAASQQQQQQHPLSASRSQHATLAQQQFYNYQQVMMKNSLSGLDPISNSNQQQQQQTSQEFSIQQEDFPALPVAQNPTSSNPNHPNNSSTPPASSSNSTIVSGGTIGGSATSGSSLEVQHQRISNTSQQIQQSINNPNAPSLPQSQSLPPGASLQSPPLPVSSSSLSTSNTTNHYSTSGICLTQSSDMNPGAVGRTFAHTLSRNAPNNDLEHSPYSLHNDSNYNTGPYQHHQQQQHLSQHHSHHISQQQQHSSSNHHLHQQQITTSNHLSQQPQPLSTSSSSITNKQPQQQHHYHHHPPVSSHHQQLPQYQTLQQHHASMSSLHQKKVTQYTDTNYIANVPNDMVSDAFGLIGLIKLINVNSSYDNLKSLAPGFDMVTELNKDLNSNRDIYTSYVAPLSSKPSGRPHDMDYHVPKEYRIRHLILDRLADPVPERLSDETLFWIFYNLCGEECQLVAAKQLMARNWRYHRVERFWLIRDPKVPSSGPELHPNFERGSFIVWDYEKLQKVPRILTLYFKDIETMQGFQNVITSKSSFPFCYNSPFVKRGSGQSLLHTIRNVVPGSSSTLPQVIAPPSLSSIAASSSTPGTSNSNNIITSKSLLTASIASLPNSSLQPVPPLLSSSSLTQPSVPLSSTLTAVSSNPNLLQQQQSIISSTQSVVANPQQTSSSNSTNNQ